MRNTPDQDPLGLPPRRLQALRRAVDRLHAWYHEHRRDLPWRCTRDPYAIWVSEVMLQQTQVETVLAYYRAWLAALPTVEALAAASEDQVLKLWEGLGYYSRARNLHRAARVVLQQHGGRVPADATAFRALPGVGPYTAAAVLSLAHDADLAVVDGNVRRVLGRLVKLTHDPRRAPWARALDQLAAALLPGGAARVHNNAMMELGALVCTPRSPDCPRCPMASPCAARRAGDPQQYPPRRPRARPPHHQVAIGLVFHRNGRVLIDQRPYDGLLGGLWEFPGGKLESGETVEQALARELQEELGLEAEVVDRLPEVNHAYTHFKVTLHPRICRLVSIAPRAADGPPRRWVLPAELERYAMPRANRKVLELLGAR